jgi:hypothetical protein
MGQRYGALPGVKGLALPGQNVLTFTGLSQVVSGYGRGLASISWVR